MKTKERRKNSLGFSQIVNSIFGAPKSHFPGVFLRYKGSL